MPKFFSGKQDVFLEIANRYANYIMIGVLKEGDKLPSVRVAAGELGVNPNTVQKAYSYLEEQGLICAVPKKGVFVMSSGADINTPQQPDSSLIDMINTLKNSGVRKETIIQVLEEVYTDD